jgi:hypothetical protein
LKPLAKSKSEMSNVDCLRLKRIYEEWWIFMGSWLTYEQFKDLVPSLPMNCTSTCRTRNLVCFPM